MAFFFLYQVKMTQQNTVSHREIWYIVWPMILANISVPLLGMVDTAVVGHLDSAHYLGAVAIGSMIFSFLFWGFGFLRMVTTGQTAQAVGKGDETQITEILKQTLRLALVLAVAMLAFQLPVSKLAFSFIQTSEQVATHAKTYFDIRIWSAPATLINYVIIGWLIGKQAAKSALIITLSINLINIALDLLFVNVWHMDVAGVALASVIAEYIGIVIAILVLNSHGIKITALFNNAHSQSRYLNKHGLFIHFNVFIRTLCIILSFAFFTTQGARYGDNVLAANSVLLNFLIFMAFVLDAFANATEVLAGKAVGNKDKTQLRQVLIVTGYWAFLAACLFSAGYFLFGSQLILLLTNIPEVIQIANDYLIWLIIMPVLAVWAYLFDGLFIGATRSVEMRNTMLFATFVCFLPAW